MTHRRRLLIRMAREESPPGVGVRLVGEAIAYRTNARCAPAGERIFRQRR
jgi:hypothetical protein